MFSNHKRLYRTIKNMLKIALIVFCTVITFFLISHIKNGKERKDEKKQNETNYSSGYACTIEQVRWDIVDHEDKLKQDDLIRINNTDDLTKQMDILLSKGLFSVPNFSDISSITEMFNVYGSDNFYSLCQKYGEYEIYRFSSANIENYGVIHVYLDENRHVYFIKGETVCSELFVPDFSNKEIVNTETTESGRLLKSINNRILYRKDIIFFRDGKIFSAIYMKLDNSNRTLLFADAETGNIIFQAPMFVVD